MKKIMQWVMAATFVCGASVFTACSNQDNPVEEPVKNKTEKEVFIEHTRATVKDLAENLNFESWEAANTYNLHFNQYILKDPNLAKSVLMSFVGQVMQTIKPVEEGSPLAAAGFQNYITIDLTNFKYRFTQKDDNSGFDVEPAERFEIVINGYNPNTQKLEKGLYRIGLKTGGTIMRRFLPMPKMEGTAMMLVLGSEFQFVLSNKLTGAWHDDFSGVLRHQLPEGAVDSSKGFTAEAIINSDILPGTVGDLGDKTQLELSISSDRVNGHANAYACWSQNNRKMFELSVKESGTNMGGISNLDLSQFSSTSSIFEVIGSILSTRSIDEAKLTVLDDLTATFSIGNLQQLLVLENEYRTVGRHYADQQTIDEYTKKMNELVKAEIYCKGTNQKLPMRLATKPVGIDYWAVYEVKFSDQDYVSLLDMLDRQTFAYILNIMDHSTDHMQQSVIIVRQLMEFVVSLSNPTQM